MVWEAEVKEIERRRKLARAQGGEQGIAKQHAKGRLTVRERIDALLDEGSFQEQGKTTALPDYDDNDELLGYVAMVWEAEVKEIERRRKLARACLLYTSPSPRDS